MARGHRNDAAPVDGAAGGRTRKKRRGPWRVVFWLALVVLVGSLSVLGYLFYTYWNGQKAYDDIVEVAFQEPDVERGFTLADFEVDWEALRAINPEVVGWVYIPGTVINYPVAHRAGDDQYYLKHNFANSSTGEFGAEYGCIMLSGENNPDFTDEVNVIYGHNMRNGSMFAFFNQMKDNAVFNDHRTVYLLTPEGNYALTTFALDHVPGTSTDIVQPTFPTPEEFHAYVQARIDQSIVTPDPGIPAADEIEKVFAFSTCDGANNKNRYITFCYVEEFLPASIAQAAPSLGGEVSGDDVAAANEASAERVS
ncbi:MAG: sortase [Eggerthellaceae bacterium]|nr:sortase [Eggerthellaceae bacterium]